MYKYKNLLFSIITIFILFIFFEIFLLLTYKLTPKLNLPNAISSIFQKFYILHDRKLDQYYCGEYHSQLFYKYKPGTCTIKNVEFETNFKINTFGTRENQEKLNSKIDIVFLGDSHTSGWGMKDNERFSNLVAEKTSLTSFNLGISSYGTVREFIQLREFSKNNNDYQYIVIQYEGNDVDENRQFYQEKNILPISSSQTYLKNRDDHIKKSSYYFFKLSNFFYNEFKDRMKLILNKTFEIQFEHMPYIPTKEEQQKWANEDSTIFLANVIDQNIDLLKGKNLIIFGLSIKDNWAQKLKEKMANKNYPFNFNVIDSTTFLKRSDFYKLDDHINKSGHEKISDQMAMVINSTIKIKKSSP